MFITTSTGFLSRELKEETGLHLNNIIDRQAQSSVFFIGPNKDSCVRFPVCNDADDLSPKLFPAFQNILVTPKK